MRKSISYRFYLYLFITMFVLICSWEANRSSAALLDQSIPQEAIRLRILANTDSAEDQALKRMIRDEIVDSMNVWIKEPLNIEDAREQIQAHQVEIEQIVAENLQNQGMDYSFKVEFGNVDFPTKMYGDKVYPAGQYEALLITIGKGEGQNWWCVLFPPLCFVDISSGDAVDNTKANKKVASKNTVSKQIEQKKGKESKEVRKKDVKPLVKKEPQKKSVLKETTAPIFTKDAYSFMLQDEIKTSLVEKEDEQDKKVIRFFIWEQFESLTSKMKSYF